MKNTIGIILAAGRGSRMKDCTEHKPKCLLELAGKPLLNWQIDALRKSGIQKILVVRGYLAGHIQGDFDTIENPRWAETNMVSTLLCAFPKIHGQTVIISYADIVYKVEHISRLTGTPGDICISYDTAWESLWHLRSENPLDDAETFREKDGFLQEIGGKTHSMEAIQGQYMGLLKFTKKGQKQVADYVASLSQSQVDKLDMTSLLRALLQQGQEISVCPVKGGWCECDTPEDIEVYEKQLANGKWLHDWR